MEVQRGEGQREGKEVLGGKGQLEDEGMEVQKGEGAAGGGLGVWRTCSDKRT